MSISSSSIGSKSLKAKHSMALKVFNIDSVRQTSTVPLALAGRGHIPSGTGAPFAGKMFSRPSQQGLLLTDHGCARAWEFPRDSWHAKAGISIHQQTSGRKVLSVINVILPWL